MPTLFWRARSDEALDRVARNGQKLSITLALGIAPRPTAALLWLSYLSFVNAGGEFLSFQWDVLLAESLLHAALLLPNTRAGAREPSRLATLAWRLLAFRVFFESGVVKWRSPDRCWRDRSALCHYYETAPLPTRFGWHAHHLPMRVQRASTTATIALECIVPFFLFGPRALRLAAATMLTAFQALIALTGNYGFFNALAAALVVWGFDDGVDTRARSRRLTTDAAAIVLGVLGVLGGASLATFVRERPLRWRALERLLERLAPFHAFHHYGPFSVMTKARPEIVVEGTEDGAHWVPYRFRYKMDRTDRAPRFVAPHQPRLDWQMWFAALDEVPSWFLRFVVRLLEAAPEVLALLADDPFDGRSPRAVRARLVEYRMATREERRRLGVWWIAQPLGTYLPPVALG